MGQRNPVFSGQGVFPTQQEGRPFFPRQKDQAFQRQEQGRPFFFGQRNPALQGQEQFLKSKGKNAMIFTILKHTRPLWSKLL